MKKRFRLSALGLAFAATTAGTSLRSFGASLFWDGSDPLTSGAQGGSGTWDSNTTLNWWDGSTSVIWPAPGGTDDDAIFGGTAGTVTLAAALTANDLTFNTTGYILSGASTLTLNGTTPTITTASGVTATVGNNTATVLAGSAGLTKAGAGTLTLNGSAVNTFTGGLTINGGTLALNFANLSTPTNLINNGNTLTLGGGALSILGKNVTAATSVQTLAGTTLASGASIVSMSKGASATSVTLNLGALDRSTPGSTLTFQPNSAWANTVSTTEIVSITSASTPGGAVTLPASGSTSYLGAGVFQGNSIPRYAQVRNTGGVYNLVAMPTSTGFTTSGGSAGTVYSFTSGQNLSGALTNYAVISNNSGAAVIALGANNYTLNGYLGIQTALTTISSASTGTVVVGAENELVINLANSGGLTISAPIVNKSGSDSNLTLSNTAGGTGVLTLSGPNTYSGQTTVNSGTMAIGTGGSINSSSGIRVNGGKFLQSNPSTAVTPVVSLIGGTAGGTIDGTGTINTVNVTDLTANKITNGNGTNTALTIGNLSFSGDGSIDIRTGGSAGLNVTGTLTTTPANGQVLVNVVSNPTWTTGNTYNLISYGTLSGSLTDFTKGSISGLGARQSSDLVLNGSNLALSISGDSVLWTGAASGAWTTNAVGSPFNWKTLAGNTTTEFLTSDDVVFDDTSATTTVDISTANVSPNSITFNNSSNNYTISSIGGFGITSGGLTKNGSGTVSLTTTNSYSGTTTVNAGTLQISGGNAIANTGLVSLANTAGATFRVSASETIGALSGGGATGGQVTLDASQTLTLSSGTQTYAGTISGLGTLTSSGAVQTLNGAISNSGGVNLTTGRMTLGGNSSYTGQTTVSAGAGIIVTANNALGAGGTGNETVLSGGAGVNSGAIGLSGGINYSTNEKIIGAGIGNTAANGEFPAVQRGIVQSVSGNNTFSGDIEINAAGFTRIGTQTGAGIALTLSGTISAVSGAQILIRAGDTDGNFVTLSNTGNSWNTDIHVYTGNNNAAESAGLRLGANNALATGASIAGATSSQAATTFDMAGFNQSLNGLAANSQLKIINSNNSQQSTLTLNPTADKGTGSTRIIDGAGTIRLVKQGDFSQTLSANNNYTGSTAIEAGRILFGTALSLYNGSSAGWTKENIIVNSGATLGLRVGSAGEFTATDVGTIASNLTTGINNNGLKAGSLLNLEVTAPTTVASLLANSTGTGAGSLGLVKTGASILTLDQANTYSGGTQLNDGYLTAAHNSALGTGIVTIGAGAERLQPANGITLANDIVINGGNGGVGNGAIQNANAGAGESVTISGDITINSLTTSGGHFATQNGGTLNLSGEVNSASTIVSVRAGTVVFSGGGSYANLQVTGTARLGASNGLASNATVDLGPAGSTGTLDLAGFNQSLAGITRSTASAGVIGNSSVTTDSTLTLTGTSIFNGVIQDTLGSGTRKTNLAVNGTGQTFTLTGTANTYSGNTTITSGTLKLGANGALSSSSTVVMNGGTLLSDGVTNTGASLSLSAASTLDLGGTSALTFTTVDAASFTSNTLQVWNWSGTLGGGGTERFMVPAGSLDSTQLSNISFYSGAGTGPLGTASFSLSNPGELVPVPEPGAILTSGLLTLAALTRRRR